jgi:hypothetical protein
MEVRPIKISLRHKFGSDRERHATSEQHVMVSWLIIAIHGNHACDARTRAQQQYGLGDP